MLRPYQREEQTPAGIFENIVHSVSEANIFISAIWMPDGQVIICGQRP